MTTFEPIWGAYLLPLALLAAGCRCEDPPANESGEASADAKPRTTEPSDLVGRARDAGKKLHLRARSECSDKNCLLATCSASCGKWLTQSFEPTSFAGPVQQNQVLFECTGYCLSPDPDAALSE